MSKRMTRMEREAMFHDAMKASGAVMKRPDASTPPVVATQALEEDEATTVSLESTDALLDALRAVSVEARILVEKGSLRDAAAWLDSMVGRLNEEIQTREN